MKVDDFGIYEFILGFIYFIMILLFGSYIKSRNIKFDPKFKYFNIGLFFKLIGVLSFCLVYIYYYQGGDTINYYLGTKSISKLILQNPKGAASLLFNTVDHRTTYGLFNSETGYPPFYMWKDPNTFAVSKLTSIFCLLGFYSFIATSFLTSLFSYIGLWKLYSVFCDLYPKKIKPFAYIILCLPSLIFWGGGIMKDSYVLGATCWITYNFYMIFIKNKKRITNLIFLIFNLLIIINIKPYIMISLLPGLLLWINTNYIKSVSNKLIKVLIIPFILVFFIFLGNFAFTNLSSSMGVYGDVDSAINQAKVIQSDLLREEQYGSNSYNIGEIDGSLIGLLKVAPLAIFTALFRPMIWEIGSPTMLISALENSILLIFASILILRTSPRKFFSIIFSDPFILYCVVFSIVFAFGVGIAGTNFGALVRYKIPLVPFLFSSVVIIKNKIK